MSNSDDANFVDNTKDDDVMSGVDQPMDDSEIVTSGSKDTALEDNLM